MRVLLVTAQVISDTGNTYMCTANMYDILRRFVYMGEIIVCSSKKFNGKNSHTKVECDLKGVIPYGNVVFRKGEYLFMSRESKNLINELVQGVDLVINYGLSNYDLYRIVKKNKKKYMSFVVCCSWDAYWNHGWKGKLIAPYKYWVSRYTIKNSDYVLYVSNRFLQNRYPTNAIYSVGCSNVKIVTMDDQTLVRRINFLNQWDGSVLNVVTVAAVDVYYKGQQYVIEAMGQLRRKNITNIHYYLVGGGTQERLKKLAEKHKVEKQVHFLGVTPHAEVFDVLDKMHLYIQPSLQEGLPRSMVEAMSRGLMCAGADTAAIPELIQSKYVLHRKSIGDIVRLLECGVTKQILIDQANVNFMEAKKYQEVVVDARRNDFFDCIKRDIEN